ncbi:MAG TPA: response regulator [Pontiella sp.]
MKILIAEDNAFSRAVLRKNLEKDGYEVVEAKNGDEAWKILQQKDSPKLALLDWMMPGLSGLEVCRKVRAVDVCSMVYLILLTAKSNNEDVIEGFAAGADDFIKKPFDKGELLARIRVGRRLVEQQTLLHRLIDTIPDPIYMKDGSGYFLGCNTAYADFVGVDADSLCGRIASDVLPANIALQAHKEDMGVSSSRKIFEWEGWVAGASGEEVYHNTIKFPIDGSAGVVSISRDLTRRMKMQQEMQRLAVVVEQSAESIMITDVNGLIIYVNASFSTMTGYHADEVLGKRPTFLKSGTHSKSYYEKLDNAINSGESWAGEITNRRKDGSLYVEEQVIYPIRDDRGNVTNFVSISRDITHEKEIEKHFRQQQKMNAIGELAGGISHDFNNILTAIIGYVSLCMNLVDEESRVHGYLSEIMKAGDRATKLVRQILAFSRQDEQVFQSVSLQEVVEDSLGMIQTAIKKNVTLEKRIDESCEDILGDETQLTQIIVNLCTNAVHALGETKEGTLSISLSQVELKDPTSKEETMDLPPGDYVRLVVRDTGPGMTSEVQEHIFEPYFTTKKKGEGSGFGLSIVHGIMRKHRGSISVKSKAGEGSTFSLYFPVFHVSEEQNEEGPEGLDLKGKRRILFVDDDQAVLSLGKEILKSFGYGVVTARNGVEALDIFKSQPEEVDAFVTDYEMPKMNGQELIREVVNLQPEMPIVLCSGYMKKVEGEDMVSKGHAVFMTKPIDWKELDCILQKMLAG